MPDAARADPQLQGDSHDPKGVWIDLYRHSFRYYREREHHSVFTPGTQAPIYIDLYVYIYIYIERERDGAGRGSCGSSGPR